MPSKLKPCIRKGAKGWMAEGGGTCFTGPDSREQATAQVQAINISQGRKSGAEWAKKLPEKK